jgi:hypothetical protein
MTRLDILIPVGKLAVAEGKWISNLLVSTKRQSRLGLGLELLDHLCCHGDPEITIAAVACIDRCLLLNALRTQVRRRARSEKCHKPTFLGRVL